MRCVRDIEIIWNDALKWAVIRDAILMPSGSPRIRWLPRISRTSPSSYNKCRPRQGDDAESMRGASFLEINAAIGTKTITATTTAARDSSEPAIICIAEMPLVFPI